MRGFSLIEIIISVSLLAMMMAISLPSFASFRRVNALRSETISVVSALQEVQNHLFTGTSYAGSTETGRYGVHMSRLPGENTQFIIFNDVGINPDGIYRDEEDLIVNGGTRVLLGGVVFDHFDSSSDFLDVVFISDGSFFLNGIPKLGGITLRQSEIGRTKTILLDGIIGKIEVE
jgi:prepilin-type N-terminal cleavage/methylation domain-containing protein